MQVEFGQLELRFEALRISGAAAQSRLMAQLSAVGQQSPVAIVDAEAATRYVLIDGYRRAEALRRLGHDTIEAVALPLSVPDALLWHRRQEAARRRTAIEDGWLLRELCEGHALSQGEVARRLGRSESWVSRRLALVEQLPERVQQLVRQAAISAHVAMKYMVPLARANASDCEKLAEGIAGQRVSVRKMHKLYVAWRAADAQTRKRIVEHPTLFLSASAHAAPSAVDPDADVLSELHALDASLRRLGRKLRSDGRQTPRSRAVCDAWAAAQQSFDALFEWLRC